MKNSSRDSFGVFGVSQGDVNFSTVEVQRSMEQARTLCWTKCADDLMI